MPPGMDPDDPLSVEVGELGIEPSTALQELERAILRQDPELDLARATTLKASILVAPWSTMMLDPLLDLARPLARRPPKHTVTITGTTSVHDHDGHIVAVSERTITTSPTGFGHGTDSYVLNGQVEMFRLADIADEPVRRPIQAGIRDRDRPLDWEGEGRQGRADLPRTGLIRQRD